MALPQPIGNRLGEVLPFPAGAAATPLPADFDPVAFAAADTLARVRAARIERFRAVCPPAYFSSDWRHPQLAPYAAQIERVVGWQYGPRGMLLAGPTGAGKSRALWALARRLVCVEGVDCRVLNAQDLAARITCELEFGRDEAGRFVAALAEIPVLILDDVGQEATAASADDRVRAWLFRLLDLRVGLMRPLFCSTNASAARLAEAASKTNPERGDPLLRRLVDLAEPVHFVPA